MVTAQEWGNATAVANAFSIGKLESSAVSALMSDVGRDVLNRITESVKVRGMSRFLTHDCIGRGIFSTAFTSGTGAAESWSDQLVNLEDNLLVACIELDVAFASQFWLGMFIL